MNQNMDMSTTPVSFSSPKTTRSSSASDDAAPLVVNADKQGKPIIVVNNLHKRYQIGRTFVHALHGVSLEVLPGEFVAVRGPSASSTTTFMNLIGCPGHPTPRTSWLSG